MRRLLPLALPWALAACAAGNPVPIVPPSALLSLGGDVRGVPWVNVPAGFAVPMPWMVGDEKWLLADYARFSIAVAPDRRTVFGVYAEAGSVDEAPARWRGYFERLTGLPPALRAGDAGMAYLVALGAPEPDGTRAFAVGAIRAAPSGEGVLVCALHGRAAPEVLARLEHLPASVCVAATVPAVPVARSRGEPGA